MTFSARSEMPCTRFDRSNIRVLRVISPSGRHGEPMVTTWRTWAGRSWAIQRASSPPKLQPTTLTGSPCSRVQRVEAREQAVEHLVGEPVVGADPPRVHVPAASAQVVAQPAGRAVGGPEPGDDQDRPALPEVGRQ